MRQYLDAVKTILETGTRKSNRTGVDTLSTFGVHYNVDLQQGFPLLTTKAIDWKNIVVEMLWFLSGRTDIEILRWHGCRFWDAWADDNGQVPSAYGNFWRQFPVHANMDKLCSPDGTLELVGVMPAFNDQIAWLINELKSNPMSRRMVVSAWAPHNAQVSKLPPCHCMFVVNVQNEYKKCDKCEGRGGSSKPLYDDGRRSWMPCPYCGGTGRFIEVHGDVAKFHGERYVLEERLCLHLTQRSCDIALGVPYNIASYALLMHLLSRFSGIPVGTFSHTLVDAHAYTCKADGSMAEYDHVPGLREQLTREPRKLPRLIISDDIKSLEDVEKLMDGASTEEVMKHFRLEGYVPWPAIKFKVAV